VADAGASAITIHGRTAKQSYSGEADWRFVAGLAAAVPIPVFGSGDCVEPQQILDRLEEGVSGVFVGRGVLRNPWILAQARDLLAGRPARTVSDEERGRFLLEYIDLLLDERIDEAEGFRHVAPGPSNLSSSSPSRHDRWVINKLRALCAWYTRGSAAGAQLRTAINSAESLPVLRRIIEDFFLSGARTIRDRSLTVAG
jgi:tRNA-dihydrouridine synthase B